jgi:hypothetical protein
VSSGTCPDEQAQRQIRESTSHDIRRHDTARQLSRLASAVLVNLPGFDSGATADLGQVEVKGLLDR